MTFEQARELFLRTHPKHDMLMVRTGRGPAGPGADDFIVVKREPFIERGETSEVTRLDSQTPGTKLVYLTFIARNEVNQRN